ncbi:ATP-dependent zinc metalloprotease FtsH [Thermodesulfobacteriota bacterium B35]
MKNNVQIGLWLLLLTGLGIIVYNIWLRETTYPPLPYTQFLSELQQNKILRVHLQGGAISGEDSAGRDFTTYAPEISTLMPLLLAHGVEITAEPPPYEGAGGLAATILPLLLIMGGWFLFSRNRSGGTAFTGNRSKRFTPNSGRRITFDDVAGIAEARQELQEVVEFLKNPERFSRLGGRIPKGVLLQGPPGTGKTLLAKAIAGEASVPFYSMGGSDFVEMFVGVGASRVRELFTEAKKNAPCIIFIDEIDAIGGKRSGGTASGGGDEREQTLNALLVEMDGFGSEETVIVLAATNRPDILDPALLRPGRFDRQVTIPIPDVKGRLKILEVHIKKIRAAKSLNLSEIARSTPGFSGADIANLVNEAALMAARRNKDAVEMEDFDNAKDKIIMGLERKNVVMSEENRRITAYHEAGHAIVAKLLPETDPLHKVTIIPRGRAMGLTQQLPIDDRLTYSREYITNRIKILMGGRIAEELIFNRLTTGASNDILSATEIATRLVCEWGMSETIGPVAYMQEQAGFLGNQSAGRPHSERTAILIDREVKRIISDCCDETRNLLRQHNRLLHQLAEVLLVNETVDAEELDIVFHCYLKELQKEEDMKRQHRCAIA